MSIESLQPFRMDKVLDPGHVASLADHIRQHGFSGRVQVEETNTSPILTDGHHRLAAAALAGMRSVPARVYANTTEGRAAATRAIVAADAAKS